MIIKNKVHEKNKIQTNNSDYVTFSYIASSKESKSPNKTLWDILIIWNAFYVSSIFFYYNITTIYNKFKLIYESYMKMKIQLKSIIK